MATKTYILFGFPGEDIHEACRAVETALNVRMTLHESGYRCGEYFRLGDVGTEHFILQKNFDDLEGEWTEPAFQDYGLLFYVNETERGPEIRAALGAVARLLTTQEV